MSSAFGMSHSGASEPGSDGRLDSWKAIATYLHRSLRSARRWEKEEGLPVHRRVQADGNSIYAFRAELDHWWTKGSGRGSASSGWLESWKEIAAYLLLSVRSARRWEKEEGLPVHRHVHGKRESVYAYRMELDGWRSNRRTKTADQDGAEECARVSGKQRTGALPAVFE
jgi:hypothetical protein